MSKAGRLLSRIQPCAVCSATIRTPTGSDDEYELVLPSEPATVERRKGGVTIVGPPACHLVCDDCVVQLNGRGQHGGEAASPGGVREVLRKRYGDDYAAWTTPASLPQMLDEAVTYLASREAREGVDFGSWQKMQDWP